MTQRLQVIVESESTEAERAAVADVFEVAGIPADVQGAYIRESAGDVLPWLTQIETAVKDLLGLVAAGAAGAVGADGWTGVKGLVRHLYEARKGKAGGVTLRDPETRTEIALPPDLPDEAYQRLAEIENPRAQQSGHLGWDSGRREWIDPWPACTAAVTRTARIRPAPSPFRRDQGQIPACGAVLAAGCAAGAPGPAVFPAGRAAR
jgi:hypothetical protein